jgi:hypothetical protein
MSGRRELGEAAATGAAPPWYRVPMVWLMIGLPAMSVVMGVTYAVIAFQVFDGVVVDDYYQRGRAINRQLARDQAALRQGLAAVAFVDREAGVVELELAAKEPERLPTDAQLLLLHATRAGFDHRLSLHRAADGRYRAALPALAAGRYHLQLEASDWRLVGELRAPEGTQASLAPAS